MTEQKDALFRQQCYINGEWVDASNRLTITVTNPYDASILGTVPECGKDETTRAILAAEKAQISWRQMTAKERRDFLLKWSSLIAKNKETLARIMTLEQGKPITEARGEIDYANSFIEWFAEEGRRVYGDVIHSNKPQQHLVVLKQAIGVVGAITPWNFPAAMITRKCSVALAAGCTFVVKPASETPFSALALASLAEEAGIPPGVFNVITGNANEIGKVLTTHPSIRKFSFTGSTKIGKLLMAQCASTIKKVSLELGGNAPFIVFDDADIDAAVQGAMASKFRNTGQTCVCANRILVQEAVYDQFAKKLVEAVKTLKLGCGLDENVNQGPLINKAAIEKVQRHIEDAIAKGAKVLIGGQAATSLGELFFEPTVLSDMTSDMLIAKEETFGPVAALFRFKTEDEAIEIANNTPFGLASYFYSRAMDRIWRVSEALQYGMVGVNVGIVSTEVAPFGGYKESGIGREGSKYGIEEYLEIKYLCMGMGVVA